jgi:hypothetical protein
MPEVYQIVCLSELGNAFKFFGTEKLTLKDLFKDTHADQIVIFRSTAPSAGFQWKRNRKLAEPTHVPTVKSQSRKNGKEVVDRSGAY